MSHINKEEFGVIGKSIQPRELFDKVTGRFRYVGDMPVELYGKILREPASLPPRPNPADVITSKVEKLKDVEAVLTHKDVPPRRLPGATKEDVTSLRIMCGLWEMKWQL